MSIVYPKKYPYIERKQPPNVFPEKYPYIERQQPPNVSPKKGNKFQSLLEIKFLDFPPLKNVFRRSRGERKQSGRIHFSLFHLTSANINMCESFATGI